MKKVTDLKENECIHCQTFEEYDAIIDLLDKEGKRWNGGKALRDIYVFEEKGVCLLPFGRGHGVTWLRVSHAEEETDVYTIHPAFDFIEQFQWGEDVEVSSGAGDFWYKAKFVATNPLNGNRSFISVNGLGEPTSWKLCRKPQSEREKIEAQIKELQEKLNNL